MKVISQIQYHANSYVRRMPGRSAPYRGNSAAIFECQLYRFRQTFLDKGQGVDEVALAGTIESNENCERLEVD